MSYRIIALDLDGTLLTSDKIILPETIDALNLAQQAGYQVLIATGRHHSAIHPFCRALQLTTPVICCNGSYLYDYQNRRVVSSDPLEKQDARTITELLRQSQIKGLLYAGDAMYYAQPTPHVERTQAWAARLPAEQRPVFRQVDDLVSVVENESMLWKFALAHSQLDELQAFADRAESQANVVCEWSWKDQIDIARRGNSKGIRLAEWVRSQGYKMHQVVAFGDNFNDLAMLEMVGLGVAMKETCDEIKKPRENRDWQQ